MARWSLPKTVRCTGKSLQGKASFEKSRGCSRRANTLACTNTDDIINFVKKMYTLILCFIHLTKSGLMPVCLLCHRARGLKDGRRLRFSSKQPAGFYWHISCLP
ncbi:MAG TPA: hypothetical protein DCZ10_03215 [Pelotomaculum sp.]|nr:hypothetical protein [Pelotomaculum sp.]